MSRLSSFALVALFSVIAAGGARAQDVSGTGQQATDLFPLPAGLVTFDLEYDGEDTFTIRLLNDQGELIEQLASARGPFRGSKAVRVPRTGQYLYDISATGSWTVRVRPPATGEPPAAQAETETEGESALRSRARYQGEQEANRVGAFPYMMGGLLGGMVAGPIGAGAAFAVASGRQVDVPNQIRASLAEREPLYVEEFTEAFRSRLRSNRRTAAVVGGATGSVIFLFALAQISHWNWGGGGGGPPGGGETP